MFSLMEKKILTYVPKLSMRKHRIITYSESHLYCFFAGTTEYFDKIQNNRYSENSKHFENCLFYVSTRNLVET